MKQKIEQIEESYNTPDPWQYQVTQDDIDRKDRLITVAKGFADDLPDKKYLRCLDIGAGEGWITKDYPAKELYGYEVSNQAAARFPVNVKRVVAPEGKYDLICATGVFYEHYHWEFFLKMIKNHASHHVLVSSVRQWELPVVNTIGPCLYSETFKYREWEQLLRIFKV